MEELKEQQQQGLRQELLERLQRAEGQRTQVRHQVWAVCVGSVCA
jgi:hypothetical protein